MSKLIVSTSDESALPFDILGIGDRIYTTTILDGDTGEKTKGYGWTAEESKAAAVDKYGEK